VSNVLTLAVGVVIGWNIVTTYYLYKVSRDTNRAIRAVVLLNKCVGEVVEINDNFIKVFKTTNNRINELEKVA
jgi:multidrug resistance efflux pump